MHILFAFVPLKAISVFCPFRRVVYWPAIRWFAAFVSEAALFFLPWVVNLQWAFEGPETRPADWKHQFMELWWEGSDGAHWWLGL